METVYESEICEELDVDGSEMDLEESFDFDYYEDAVESGDVHPAVKAVLSESVGSLWKMDSDRTWNLVTKILQYAVENDEWLIVNSFVGQINFAGIQFSVSNDVLFEVVSRSDAFDMFEQLIQLDIHANENAEYGILATMAEEKGNVKVANWLTAFIIRRNIGDAQTYAESAVVEMINENSEVEEFFDSEASYEDLYNEMRSCEKPDTDYFKVISELAGNVGSKDFSEKMKVWHYCLNSSIDESELSVDDEENCVAIINMIEAAGLEGEMAFERFEDLVENSLTMTAIGTGVVTCLEDLDKISSSAAVESRIRRI